MITFHKIIYKNFLAAGNNPIEIDLNRNKSTLIVGHNGAGKSTILDALSFGLFGKPHRSVSKTQLVNSVNGKGAEVEVVFTIGNHAFKIIRGIKPNVFEIWQDGEMLDQSANVRDYQKFLEYNIRDVELVGLLEEKLRLIELAISLAYDSGINYEEVFSPVRVWDATIFNHLRKENIVVPPANHNDKEGEYEGAYVKKPQVGMFVNRL